MSESASVSGALGDALAGFLAAAVATALTTSYLDRIPVKHGPEGMIVFPLIVACVAAATATRVWLTDGDAAIVAALRVMLATIASGYAVFAVLKGWSGLGIWVLFTVPFSLGFCALGGLIGYFSVRLARRARDADDQDRRITGRRRS